MTEFEQGYEQARFDFLSVIKIAEKDFENSVIGKKGDAVFANRCDAIRQTLKEVDKHIRELKNV